MTGAPDLDKRVEDAANVDISCFVSFTGTQSERELINGLFHKLWGLRESWH